jgi:PAS domain-containing protein
MLLYGFALSISGCVILMRTAIRWRQPGEGARRLAIGAAPLVTLIGSGLYFSGLWSLPADPTPLLLGGSLLLLHGGLFGGGLLQPLAISQCALIEQLPVAIVLTDRGGVVVDVNRLAARRLGVTSHTAIGRNFEAVIDAADAGIEFEVTPVRSAGAEAGRIVLLDPPDKPSASRLRAQEVER